MRHGFLRKVVLLCLVMMVALTVDTIVMWAVTNTPPDAGSLGILMGGWCGELLLTLLKRKFEVEDKTNDKEDDQSCTSGKS